MDKEMTFLGQALISPKRPLAAVVGGAKVSSKLSILRSLLGRVDKLLVGGAMVYTFYLAKGYAVGDSLVEEALVKEALDVLEAAKQHGVELILAPDSHVVSTELLHPAGGGKKCTEGFTAARHHKTDATYLPTADTETCRRLQPDRGAHSATKGGLSDAEAVAVTSTAEGPMYFPLIAQPEPLTTRNDAIPPGHTGVDIGKETIQTFCSALEGCETVLWNGALTTSNCSFCCGACFLPSFIINA